MRRKGCIWGVLAALLLCVGRVGAIGEPTGTLWDVAAIIPDDTALYMAIDIGSETVVDLDTLINRVIDQLPASLAVPTFDLEDELRRSLGDAGFDYDALREGVGRYMALSLTDEAVETLVNNPNATRIDGLRLYVQVTDRAALEEGLPPFLTQQGRERGSDTLFDLGVARIILNDEWLTLYTDRREPDVGDSLAQLPDYQRLAEQVQDETYGLLMYMSAEALALTTAPGTDPELLEASTQPGLLGGGLDEQRTLFLDTVQVLPADAPITTFVPETPVDLEFLRVVRRDADLVIHFTDLAAYLDYFIVALDSFAPPGSEREMREVVRTLQELEDSIAWMKGEAVLYSTIDLDTIIELDTLEDLDFLPFEFAFVVQTDDEAAARQTWAELVGILASDSTIETDEIVLNGITMSQVIVSVPNGRRTIEIEMVLGVYEGHAFIATPVMAVFLVRDPAETPDLTLGDEKIYQDASGWFLPGTRQLLYSSENGLISFMGLIVFLSVGSTFPDLDASLPASPYVQMGGSAEVLMVLRDIFHSASITGTLDDGIQVTRFVLTLE